MRAPILLVVGAAVLLLAGYAWLRDEPISPDAQAWLSPAEHQVTHSEAYLLLLGIHAPIGQSPRELGARTLAAYQAWRVAHSVSEPFSPDQHAMLPLPDGEFFCPITLAACFARLVERSPELPAILGTHGELLERYRQFIALDDYLTLAQPGPDEPIPALSYLLRGAHLLGLQALQQALAGETHAASSLLLEERRALRQYLARADHLVLKMALVALLNRNLEWQARLQRVGLVAVAQDTAALTLEERSLSRALQHEFQAQAAVYHSLGAERRVRGSLDMWLGYKPQMSINASLARYQVAAQLSELPPQAFSQAMAHVPAQQVPHTGVRNWVGDVLLAIKVPDWNRYAARIHDLDAKLRLLALSAALPQDVVEADVASLNGAQNPYEPTQRPFLDDQGRVCYDGPFDAKEAGRCVPL